jgi:hypothetical protein
MTARRAPAAHLCLRVGSRHEVAFVPFPAKAPMFVIGAAGTLVSLTLPEQVEAGHVDFARQLAAKAWAYAVAVERRYRGLPPLPEASIPYTLTARAEALLDTAEPGTSRTNPTSNPNRPPKTSGAGSPNAPKPRCSVTTPPTPGRTRPTWTSS